MKRVKNSLLFHLGNLFKLFGFVMINPDKAIDLISKVALATNEVEILTFLKALVLQLFDRDLSNDTTNPLKLVCFRIKLFNDV